MTGTHIQRFSDRIKNPDYTGENRCIPCTIVNVVIALCVSLLAWFLTPLAGVAVAVGALLTIYLRGYLVPGTPTLTKRYAPSWVLRWFDKTPEPSADPIEDLDIEEFLLDADILVDEEDDLELDPDFEAAWYDQMTAVTDDRSDASRLAEMLGVSAEEFEIVSHDDAFVVQSDGLRVGQWESHAAFIADIAATEELAERCPRWSSLTMAQQSEVLGGLRIFLERCPQCGGPIEIGQEVVESCCRSVDVIATTCQQCGARLFESPFDPEAIEQSDSDTEARTNGSTAVG